MTSMAFWGQKGVGRSTPTIKPRRHLLAKRTHAAGLQQRTRRACVHCLKRDDVAVVEQELPKSRLRLTLTIEPSFHQECYDSVLDEVRKSVKVKGFRDAKKAPLQLLMSAAGGEETVKGRVIEEVVEKALGVVVEDYSNRAIADSDSLDTSVQDILKTFDLEKSLTFDVSFDVLSELKWLAPYNNVKVEVRASSDDAGDEAKVDLEIKQMLKQNGVTRIVGHRGLQKSDLGIIDIDFIRKDTNESIPGMKQEKFAYDTDMEDALNLLQYLEGMKIGEEREFDIVFPDDWEPPIYRGLSAQVYTNMRELFEWELPEFNDDFVKNIDKTTTMTADEFRTELIKGVKAKRIERDDYAVQDALCDKLADIVDMIIPESVVKETGKSKYMDQVIRLQSKGKIPVEAVQQLVTPEMVDKYIESHKDELERYQRAIAALDAIAKEKNLVASEEEIEAEYNQVAREFEASEEKYDPERLREMCIEVLGTQKVVEWFKDNGCVTVLPPL